MNLILPIIIVTAVALLALLALHYQWRKKYRKKGGMVDHFEALARRYREKLECVKEDRERLSREVLDVCSRMKGVTEQRDAALAAEAEMANECVKRGRVLSKNENEITHLKRHNKDLREHLKEAVPEFTKGRNVLVRNTRSRGDVREMARILRAWTEWGNIDAPIQMYRVVLKRRNKSGGPIYLNLVQKDVEEA